MCVCVCACVCVCVCEYGCGRCISVISCVCEWKMCLCTMFVFVYKELCFLHRQHGMAHGLADYVGTVL